MANRAGWDVPLPVSGAEEPDAAGCEDGDDEEGWSTAGRVQPASSRPASAAAAARRQRECFRTMGPDSFRSSFPDNGACYTG